jgi:argininosuccinate lyase
MFWPITSAPCSERTPEVTDGPVTAAWGSRFSEPLASDALDYTYTTDVDVRLIGPDLWGTVAHVIMLGETKIIPSLAARQVVSALKDLVHLHNNGSLTLRRELEDVHLNIEQFVRDRVGPIGGAMHTARSRNDQVVTATRLYLRDAVCDLADGVCSLVKMQLHRARTGVDDLLVAYTHSQPAQPMTLGFWFSGYASMFLRDLERLDGLYARLDRCPLGACAVAGTSFPIDRERTRELLGFTEIEEHALDATSSRDTMIELASALAIMMSTLSRLSEELVLWSTHEVGLVRIDDELSTGSSIMPQKRNPVVAELGRARAGTVFASVLELLVVVKGVPSGYSCDLQQDKPAVWRALDVSMASIKMLTRQLASARFDPARARLICDGGFVAATELANHLVREHGLVFRDAYAVTGEVIKELEAAGSTLAHNDRVVVALAARGIHVDGERLAVLLDPSHIVATYTSRGGTSPASVSEVIGRLDRRLAAAEASWSERRNCAARAYQHTMAVADAVAGNSGAA